MKTNDCALYFRSITDDPDQNFISDTELAVHLANAYNQFRRTVAMYDPSYYEVSIDRPAPNATSLSLDGLVLGTTPTSTRLESIVRVCITDGAVPSTVKRVMRPASSFETLMSGSTFGDVAYWLQNRTLRFNVQVSQPIRIDYLPVSTVSWTIATPTFIDDLCEGEFGDIVALMAARAYKMKDISSSALGRYHDELLKSRLSDLRSFLSKGRSGNSYRRIEVVDDETDW